MESIPGGCLGYIIYIGDEILPRYRIIINHDIRIPFLTNPGFPWKVQSLIGSTMGSCGVLPPTLDHRDYYIFRIGISTINLYLPLLFWEHFRVLT